MGEVQAVSKLSVPEFTATLGVIDRVTAPPLQYVDPYTGETVNTPGFSEKVEVIKVEIKNQNRPDKSVDNELYYDVRTKGYYDQDEDVWYGQGDPSLLNPLYKYGSMPQSDGSYTQILLPAGTYPTGGKVDVQVQVKYGHFFMNNLYRYEFTGELSGWSNSKTVTITRDSNEVPNLTEATPNSTSATDQNEIQTDLTITQIPLTELLFVFLLCPVIAVLIIVLLYMYEKRKTARYKQDSQT
jgi:hypothetical protein